MNITAWIIYNGNLSEEKFLDYANWFEKACQKHDIQSKVYKNNELFVTIENNKSVLKGTGEPLPDFVLFADKDIRLARQLELMDVRVYNSARSIEICDDKNLMYQILANHGVKIPKTILAPKIFAEVKDLSVYQTILEEFQFPFIMKEAFGSFGQQVYLIHNQDEFFHKVKELKHTPYCIQECIQSSFGKDIRLNVVGDEVVAAMKRYSETDFRANVSAGGKMERYKPTTEEIEAAILASKIVGTDFAGVDLLFGEDGPIVCEVNSNAHIRNIYDCTGINVAEPTIDYIVKDLKK